MNEPDFAKELLVARKDMIDTSDKLVLARFKNTPWKQLSRSHQAKSVGTHTIPAAPPNGARAEKPLLTQDRLFSALAIAAGIIIIIMSSIGIIWILENSSSSPVRYITRPQAALSPQVVPDAGRTIIYNNTPVIRQVVELEGAETCDALRWTEGGILKTKYVCERKE